ncbi:MAG: rod shape-determining protein [Pyrinomonadaceae bacterium]
MSLFTRRFYIRINRERVRIDSPGIAYGYDDAAVLAVRTEGAKKIVAAVGVSAESMRGAPFVELHRPFAHPRIIIDDYVTAAKLLQHGLWTLYQKMHWSPIRRSMKMIIHPIHTLEGGLTEVERYALVRLADLCGARQVAVHTGRELAVTEIETYGVGANGSIFQPTSLTPFGRHGRG